MFELFMVIAAIASAAMGAYSAVQQGQAQKKAADYNRQVAENQAAWSEYNARVEADQIRQQAEIYEYNAVLSEQQAERDAEAAEERKQKLLSAQAARYGKAGLMLEGTPLEVMSISAMEADKDIESILYEGSLEAWNWRTRGEASERSAAAGEISGVNLADTYRAEAALNTMKGQSAKSQSLFQAGSTILTGAARAASYGGKVKGRVPTGGYYDMGPWDSSYY
jgi:hypothetical protein